MRARSPALQVWIDEIALRYALSDDDRRAILKLPGTLRTYPSGGDLVTLGEQHAYLSLVIEGVAARYAQFADGTRQFSALYTPGDMIGLRSLVSAEATASVQALELTRVISIAAADIRALAATAPTLRAALISSRMIEEQVAIAWMVNLGHNQALGRISHLLCEFACRHAPRGEWRERFKLPLTQSQVGEAVGLTAVHVNRKLRKLRELGAVTIADHWVRIVNWCLLREIGNFDPAYLYDQSRQPVQVAWVNPA